MDTHLYVSIDGIPVARFSVYRAGLFSLKPTSAGGAAEAAARFIPVSPTEEELDQYVIGGEWPVRPPGTEE